MIEKYRQDLPHGITLSCRATGERGRPVMVFLHGFPEAAFVWDELLEHFARAENGGYRCVAPNLRGFEQSSQPADVKLYRARHLVQDIAALIEIEGAPLECLVAHDWGGAVAWNLANQMPRLAKRLAIINSPHPNIFARELANNPKQQAASAYMNFLVRPDAEELLRADDYRRMFRFFGGAAWMTEDVRQQYRDIWDASLTGGCNYYRASPVRPPTETDLGAAALSLPLEMGTISIPTLVLWGMDDVALGPELIEGLDGYIADLTLEKVEGVGHWIIHERPAFIAERLEHFLGRTSSPAALS